MTKRLNTIFSVIEKCDKFADVGCDHGIISYEMISSGKCNKIVISDISAKSLKKAQTLLYKYVQEGSVTSVVCDGLDKIPSDCDCVLIAGIGGEEIIKILSKATFKPKSLILQPMKNQDKVREYLVELGYGIKRDFTFFDGKYYHLICADLTFKMPPYNQVEFKFGRENLRIKSNDFISYIKHSISIIEKYQKNVVSYCDLAYANQELTILKEVLNEN